MLSLYNAIVLPLRLDAGYALLTIVIIIIEVANVVLKMFSSRSPNQEGQKEEEEEESNDNTETEFSDFSVNQNATLLMLQFAIDQMSLEVGKINSFSLKSELRGGCNTKK